MPIKGNLSVSITFNELPGDVTTDKNGWKRFSLDCGGRTVTVNLRPRMYGKLEEGAKTAGYKAVLTGKMGRGNQGGFELEEPALQILLPKPPDTPPDW